MKKRIFAAILSALFALTLGTAVYANDGIGVTIDGQAVLFGAQGPAIVDDRTLVPVRGVFEHLGFEVDWDAGTRQATLTSHAYTVVLTIDSANFTTNGASHALDVPAQIIGGSTMVPLRAVLESVGYYLSWDAGTRTVLISSTPFETPVAGLAHAASTFSTLWGTSFVIRPDGSLWAWGSNDAGQIGDGTMTEWDWFDDTGVDNNRRTPVRIMDDVVAVSAGINHAAAIRGDGSLWMWGSNEFGQLGDGTGGNWDARSLVPIRVMEDVIYVAAGSHHTTAIRSDGSLWAWGFNSLGEVGDGTTTHRMSPVRIMDDVVAVSAGQEHTAAIRADGSLWTWGSSRFGNLGNGEAALTMAAAANPTPIRIMEDVAAVSVGNGNTMAIRGDGSLWAWGINWQGQLGIGVYESSTPYGTVQPANAQRAVPARVLDDVIAVSATTGHTVAIRSDNSLWAWGRVHVGLSGEATAITRPAPFRVMEGVVAISAGDGMTLIAKDDGSLWAAGGNWEGRLGAGTDDQTFVQVFESIMPAN